MAKHTNTATVRTAEGNVELTKVSAHRDYVVASVANFEDGTQALFSWHLTAEAGRKFIESAAARRSATYNERHHGGSKFVSFELVPVRNEVKYTKAELAAQAAEAPEVLPVVELSGEMTEAPEESALYAPTTIDDAPAETIVAPVEETPAPVKVRKPRKPAKKVVMAEADVEETVKGGMGTHKIGDVVVSKDGLEWTVAGSAEKGKTVRIVREVDGVKKTRLSMHYNITKK